MLWWCGNINVSHIRLYYPGSGSETHNYGSRYVLHGSYESRSISDKKYRIWADPDLQNCIIHMYWRKKYSSFLSWVRKDGIWRNDTVRRTFTNQRKLSMFTLTLIKMRKKCTLLILVYTALPSTIFRYWTNKYFLSVLNLISTWTFCSPLMLSTDEEKCTSSEVSHNSNRKK